MEKSIQILIADRNPHIREFLRRELTTSGYHVQLVDNGKDLLKLVYSRPQIDLLVLDPDFLCEDATYTARKIADRIPQLPVVLHCVRGTDNLSDFSEEYVVHIEKNGNSVEILKETIQKMLSDPIGPKKPVMHQ